MGSTGSPLDPTRLASEERALVVLAITHFAERAPALMQCLAPPSGPRCTEAARAILEIPEPRRAQLLARETAELFAPLPLGLELVHPSWLRACLGLIPLGLRRRLLATLPSSLRHKLEGLDSSSGASLPSAPPGAPFLPAPAARQAATAALRETPPEASASSSDRQAATAALRETPPEASASSSEDPVSAALPLSQATGSSGGLRDVLTAVGKTADSVGRRSGPHVLGWLVRLVFGQFVPMSVATLGQALGTDEGAAGTEPMAAVIAAGRERVALALSHAPRTALAAVCSRLPPEEARALVRAVGACQPKESERRVAQADLAEAAANIPPGSNGLLLLGHVGARVLGRQLAGKGDAARVLAYALPAELGRVLLDAAKVWGGVQTSPDRPLSNEGAIGPQAGQDEAAAPEARGKGEE
jgi:hypothetical protein